MESLNHQLLFKPDKIFYFQGQKSSCSWIRTFSVIWNWVECFSLVFHWLHCLLFHRKNTAPAGHCKKFLSREWRFQYLYDWLKLWHFSLMQSSDCTCRAWSLTMKHFQQKKPKKLYYSKKTNIIKTISNIHSSYISHGIQLVNIYVYGLQEWSCQLYNESSNILHFLLSDTKFLPMFLNIKEFRNQLSSQILFINSSL